MGTLSTGFLSRLLIFLMLLGSSASGASTCPSYLTGNLEAKIQATGLSAQHIASMRDHSLGLIDLTQLDKAQAKGVLLGLSEPENQYNSIVQTFGLISFSEAYKIFGIDLGESRHWDKFMETLTHSEKGVVFLVPSRLWSHPDGVYTKREMYWLLNHPEQMKNVLFVF